MNKVSLYIGLATATSLILALVSGINMIYLKIWNLAGVFGVIFLILLIFWKFTRYA